MASGSADGRVQRGARNREAIVDAIYELVRETHMPPSVEDVARRAGVGRRTVFRQFDDVDALYQTMSERVTREAIELLAPTEPSGDLVTDLEALVARRARVFEHITPFRRAARLVRHESAHLQKQDKMMAAGFRMGLLAVLSPHVSGASVDTIEAIELLLSFEAWERLRHQQAASVKRARQVLVGASLALARAASAPAANT